MSSAPSPSPNFAPGVNLGGSTLSAFSVKSTVLYIALSLGVLLIVTGILGLALVFFSRPARRRERILAALERHRLAALQEAREEEQDFKPQLRAVPVIVVQPGLEGVAYGKAEDSTGSEAAKEEASSPCIPAAADPEDPELGHTAAAESSAGRSSGSPGHSSSSSDSPSEDVEQGHIFYNPLTHYLTERRARYFTASVDI